MNFARHVPFQVVVKLNRGVSLDSEARNSVISRLPPEAHISSDFNDAGFAVIDLPFESNLDDVIRQLETSEVVEFAEPNYIDEGTKR